MRRGELSYLKDATLRRRTYFLYLQCSSHFHMRLFSANSTSCCKIFNPNEEKGHINLIYAHVRGLTILWSELRMKSLHWRIIR
jgi:hypothetical protein